MGLELRHGDEVGLRRFGRQREFHQLRHCFRPPRPSHGKGAEFANTPLHDKLFEVYRIGHSPCGHALACHIVSAGYFHERCISGLKYVMCIGILQCQLRRYWVRGRTPQTSFRPEGSPLGTCGDSMAARTSGVGDVLASRAITCTMPGYFLL